MKTITVEIEDDEILVAIKQPEGYEDVHPHILMDDSDLHNAFEWRVLGPVENT